MVISVARRQYPAFSAAVTLRRVRGVVVRVVPGPQPVR